jgi:hypothetical protein
MIVDDMKKVGSGHFEQLIMDVVAVECRSRLGQRRFEEAPVPQTGCAAVAGKLQSVNVEYVLERKEFWFHLASYG